MRRVVVRICALVMLVLVLSAAALSAQDAAGAAPQLRWSIEGAAGVQLAYTGTIQSSAFGFAPTRSLTLLVSAERSRTEDEKEFPMYAKTPLVIGESDPEGCAACGVTHYPQNGYRNGTMFPTYTALQIARTYELADLHQVNLLGAVTWAFLFEDQPYFDGFRDLATNGIAKPVLNTFRMLGQMSGDRVQAISSAGLPVAEIRDKGVRGAPDISALAARSARSATVLMWNYHDDDVPAPAAPIRLSIEGLPAGRATLTHYRIDEDHSNSYAAWLKMGSPQKPTPAQYAELEKASELRELAPAREITIGGDGRVAAAFDLPRKSVSFIKVSW